MTTGAQSNAAQDIILKISAALISQLPGDRPTDGVECWLVGLCFGGIQLSNGLYAPRTKTLKSKENTRGVCSSTVQQ